MQEQQALIKVKWKGEGRDKFISEVCKPRADDGDEKAQMCIDVLSRLETRAVIQNKDEAQAMVELLSEFLSMCTKFGSLWSHPQIFRCIRRVIDTIEKEVTRMGSGYVEDFDEMDVYFSSRTAARSAVREELEQEDSEVSERLLPIFGRRMMNLRINTYSEAVELRDWLEAYLPVDKEYGSAERTAMQKAITRVIDEVDDELQARDNRLVIE